MNILNLYIELTKKVNDLHYVLLDDFIEYLQEIQEKVSDIRKEYTQQEIETSLQKEFQYIAVEGEPHKIYINKNIPTSEIVEAMIDNLLEDRNDFPSEYKMEIIPFLIAYKINKEFFQL